MAQVLQLIRKAEVKRRTSLSNTMLHELLKANEFPIPVYLTSSKRLPVWSASEVEDWLLQRLNKRSTGTPCKGAEE